MKQIPSRKANRCSASQYISSILRNLEVNSDVHKSSHWSPFWTLQFWSFASYSAI